MQQYPKPYEMYGFWLRNQTVQREYGRGTTDGWQAHKACSSGRGYTNSSGSLCDAQTYPQPLYQDDYTAASAITLLRRRDMSKPFFLHVSFPGPHPPFSVTAAMHDRVSKLGAWPNATDDPKAPANLAAACAGNHEPSNAHTRCDYAAELLNIDVLFQRVMDEIRTQGELDKTIVCMTSDHGELLGDHGDFDKSKPWQSSVGVPLVCAGPGIASGKVVHAPVGTVDLAATFLDYASATLPAGMTSRSMRQLLDANASKPANAPHMPRTFVKSGLGNWRLVVQVDPVNGKSYKLICCQGECPEAPSTAPKPNSKGFTRMLIAVDDDPYDMHDLSADESMSTILKRMLPLLPVEYTDGCSS